MLKKELTAEHLREILHYDPERGTFAWDTCIGKFIFPGKQAGFRTGQGMRICIYRTHYDMDRLAFLYMTGEWPKGKVGHVNSDRFDNRWANLKDVPLTVNRKSTSLRKDNKSGCPGVKLCKARPGKCSEHWEASIEINRKKIHLGTFHDKEEAIEARKAAEIEHGVRVPGVEEGA